MPSSGTEAVRVMRTTLRPKTAAGIPASTRNRMCLKKKRRVQLNVHQHVSPGNNESNNGAFRV